MVNAPQFRKSDKCSQDGRRNTEISDETKKVYEIFVEELRESRKKQKISIADCANVLGISSFKYSQLENCKNYYFSLMDWCEVFEFLENR